MGVVMKVITGIGPRVGSSFLMNEAKKAGLLVTAPKFVDWIHVKDQNIQGYWEFDPQETKQGLDNYKWKDQVVKLWASSLAYTDSYKIKKVVVLERRNKIKQRESITKTLRLEEQQLGITTGLTADDVIEEHVNYMYKWINSNPTCDLIHVYTEDLNKDLQVILKFLGGT